MLYNIRPAHLSYIVEDRLAAAWILRDVLGMEIVRHEEFRLAPSSICQQPPDGQWCKTVYAFGHEATHFAIQQVYCYQGLDVIEFGNDFVGAKIRSLEAIARAKAIGVEGHHESPDTFVTYSKTGTGHNYWLIDHTDHRNPDPYFEEILNVVNMEESMRYWHDLLGVDIVDLQKNQFSLFFRNGSPILSLKQTTNPLVLSPAHLGFVMPKSELQDLSERMMKSGTVVQQPFGRVQYVGRNSDYLVILKDPSGYFLYFHDQESHERLLNHDLKGEARFRISVLKEQQARGQKLNSLQIRYALDSIN